jgi:hypothetical protein
MANIKEKDFITRVRQRADMEDNYFVSDVEIQTYVNAGIAELHDILIQTYGQDYYLSSHTFTTTSGTDSYALPSGFYKLRGVDCKINGQDWFTLRPFNFNERNLYQNWGQWSVLGLSNIRYRMFGSNVVFTPVPDTTTEVRLWYIPTSQKFNSATPGTSTTTYDDINGYAEYIVVDAAIKCLQKEESDVQVLLLQKQAMKKNIQESANNRDAGHPLSVTDIYDANNRFWYTRST